MNLTAAQFAPPVVLKGREEPQNTDIEIAILGGILGDPLAYDRVSGITTAKHFYLSYHGQVFTAMTTLRELSRPIDPIGVMAQLGEMDVTNAQSLVFDLIDRIPSATNIDHHAELLAKKWRLRETIRLCREAAQMAYDPAATPEGIRIHIQDGLTALAGDSRGGVASIGDAIGVRLDELSQRCETGELGFVPTGIADLDEVLLGGLRPGKLIVIAGRPGMGKSALGVSNVLPAIAAASGKPSIVFSLEMDRAELVDRFLARELTHPWQIQDRNLASLDWAELGVIGSRLSGLPIFIDDRAGATFDHICATCRRLKAEQGDLGCVVIDYLQIMGGLDNESNMALSIGKIANGFKNLARELNTAIILLSQLNRGVEGRQDKRPTSADLRQSGAIEEAADIVLMIYRDDIYNPDSPDRGVAELIITKQRGAPTGTVKTVFDGARSKFHPITVYPSPKPFKDNHDDF
jgi:replicative DNA helicase